MQKGRASKYVELLESEACVLTARKDCVVYVCLTVQTKGSTEHLNIGGKCQGLILAAQPVSSMCSRSLFEVCVDFKLAW